MVIITQFSSSPLKSLFNLIEAVGALRLYVLVLTAALILASYHLGSLQDQVRVLRSEGSKSAANNAPSAGALATVQTGHFPVRGNPAAKVTLIEFADFRCPFCAKFYQDAEAGLIRDYVNTGKVRYAFRSNPILGQESEWASEAAECANEQGKFWEYHDYLFSHQAAESDLVYYSKDNLTKYAVEIGLNETQFSDCLKSGKYADKVAQDKSDAQAAGVSGTPTTFIKGQKVSGAQPYASLKIVIDQLLAK